MIHLMTTVSGKPIVPMNGAFVSGIFAHYSEPVQGGYSGTDLVFLNRNENGTASEPAPENVQIVLRLLLQYLTGLELKYQQTNLHFMDISVLEKQITENLNVIYAFDKSQYNALNQFRTELLELSNQLQKKMQAPETGATEVWHSAEKPVREMREKILGVLSAASEEKQTSAALSGEILRRSIAQNMKMFLRKTEIHSGKVFFSEPSAAGVLPSPATGRAAVYVRDRNHLVSGENGAAFALPYYRDRFHDMEPVYAESPYRLLKEQRELSFTRTIRSVAENIRYRNLLLTGKGMDAELVEQYRERLYRTVMADAANPYRLFAAKRLETKLRQPVREHTEETPTTYPFANTEMVYAEQTQRNSDSAEAEQTVASETMLREMRSAEKRLSEIRYLQNARGAAENIRYRNLLMSGKGTDAKAVRQYREQLYHTVMTDASHPYRLFAEQRFETKLLRTVKERTGEAPYDSANTEMVYAEQVQRGNESTEAAQTAAAETMQREIRSGEQLLSEIRYLQKVRGAAENIRYRNLILSGKGLNTGALREYQRQLYHTELVNAADPQRLFLHSPGESAGRTETYRLLAEMQHLTATEQNRITETTVQNAINKITETDLSHRFAERQTEKEQLLQQVSAILTEQQRESVSPEQSALSREIKTVLREILSSEGGIQKIGFPSEAGGSAAAENIRYRNLVLSGRASEAKALQQYRASIYHRMPLYGADPIRMFAGSKRNTFAEDLPTHETEIRQTKAIFREGFVSENPLLLNSDRAAESMRYRDLVLSGGAKETVHLQQYMETLYHRERTKAANPYRLFTERWVENAAKEFFRHSSTEQQREIRMLQEETEKIRTETEIRSSSMQKILSERERKLEMQQQEIYSEDFLQRILKTEAQAPDSFFRNRHREEELFPQLTGAAAESIRYRNRVLSGRTAEVGNLSSYYQWLYRTELIHAVKHYQPAEEHQTEAMMFAKAAEHFIAEAAQQNQRKNSLPASWNAKTMILRQLLPLQPIVQDAVHFQIRETLAENIRHRHQMFADRTAETAVVPSKSTQIQTTEPIKAEFLYRQSPEARGESVTERNIQQRLTEQQRIIEAFRTETKKMPSAFEGSSKESKSLPGERTRELLNRDAASAERILTEIHHPQTAKAVAEIIRRQNPMLNDETTAGSKPLMNKQQAQSPASAILEHPHWSMSDYLKEAERNGLLSGNIVAGRTLHKAYTSPEQLLKVLAPLQTVEAKNITNLLLQASDEPAESQYRSIPPQELKHRRTDAPEERVESQIAPDTEAMQDQILNEIRTVTKKEITKPEHRDKLVKQLEERLKQQEKVIRKIQEAQNPDAMKVSVSEVQRIKKEILGSINQDLRLERMRRGFS